MNKKAIIKINPKTHKKQIICPYCGEVQFETEPYKRIDTISIKCNGFLCRNHFVIEE